MDSSADLSDFTLSSAELDASADSSPGAGPGPGPSSAGPSKTVSPTTKKAPSLGPVQPSPGLLDSIKGHEVNYDLLVTITEEKSIDAMRELLLNNYRKISGYDYLIETLVDVIKHYGPPGVPVEKHTNATIVVTELVRIMDDSYRKWAMFDVPMKNLGLLKGSALERMIDISKDKLSQILESTEEKLVFYRDQMQILEFEKFDLQTDIKILTTRLEKAKLQIQDLKGERLHIDIPREQEFMDNLQLNLSMTEYLNSSLQEQNYKLRKSNEQIYAELIALEKQIAEEHKEHLKEISEFCKDLELEEGIRKEVVKKIESLTEDPNEIVEAVNKWMKAINTVIKSRLEQISEMGKKAKKLSDNIAMRQIEIVDLEDRQTQINKKVEGLRQEHRQLTIEERFFSAALVNQRKRNEQLRKEQETASGSGVGLAGLSPYVGPRAVERPRHWRPPSFNAARFEQKFVPLFEESETDDSFVSPERLRVQSPEYHERTHFDDSPLSFEASPGRSSSPYSSGSGPSPHRIDTPTPPSPTIRQAVGVGTQTLSRPQSEFAPGVSAVNPATQTLGGVSNRIDVGESFNMQTVHSGPPAPYNQITRVDSTIPKAGPSRMVDSPLHVKHRVTFTPDQYETPFISKSRFGYTDPTAKVLNLPPGAEFDVPTGMRKTIVLTSPKRKEPLVVDIDVDPKPLTETESGEHFICDISLAVQQAKKQRYISDRARFRHLSPVFTFDEPPAVTPTVDRRYGLHTPRGIFQRRHYNVRRVYRPDEYQSPDLPWSPHDLPDARSPISGLYPSPKISDTSISWERGPDTPPLIKGPYYRSQLPESDGTFSSSPSPVIKGRYYGRETPESDFYSSPSPVIQRSAYGRETPESDFYSSPSPVIQRSAYGRRSPFSDSPSPVIKGPSYMRRSQVQDRILDRSQSPPLSSPSPKSSDRSSTRPKSLLSRSPSPEYDRTFDSHGQTFGHGETFESHEHTADTPSYSYGSRSPQMDRTFDRSPSPQRNQIYSRTSSPRMNQTFSRSPSPEINQIFNRSLSPRMNQTFSRSPSPQRNENFIETPSPEVHVSFEESPLDTGYYGEDYLPEFKTY